MAVVVVVMLAAAIRYHRLLEATGVIHNHNRSMKMLVRKSQKKIDRIIRRKERNHNLKEKILTLAD